MLDFAAGLPAGPDALPGPGVGVTGRVCAAHPGLLAARDILVLAGKGKAFGCLDRLLVRQGGPQVLAGSVLALAATIAAWERLTGTSSAELVAGVVR